MDAPIKETANMLLQHLRDHVNPAFSSDLAPMLDAFEKGRIRFDREIWHAPAVGLNDPHEAGELLLRATTTFGAHINPEPITHLVGRSGCHAAYDSLVVLYAVRQAIEQDVFPVSVNISARHAADPTSLLALHTLLEEHFSGLASPQQIIFEFLEDHDAANPNHDALTQMKALGYRFAIDDLPHKDDPRLETLGPYADFVKIDGHTLQRFRDGALKASEMHGFLKTISRHAPNAAILCEWVDSLMEADSLRRQFSMIRYVQGQHLDNAQKQPPAPFLTPKVA